MITLLFMKVYQIFLLLNFVSSYKKRISRKNNSELFFNEFNIFQIYDLTVDLCWKFGAIPFIFVDLGNFLQNFHIPNLTVLGANLSKKLFLSLRLHISISYHNFSSKIELHIDNDVSWWMFSVLNKKIKRHLFCGQITLGSPWRNIVSCELIWKNLKLIFDFFKFS